MKTPFSIKLLRKLRPMFERMGVEYNLLERIIQIKLVMDDRKVSVLSQNQSKQSNGKKFLKYEDFMNLFIGFMLSMILASNILPIFYSMSMLLGTILLYTVFYLLADFSTVILDLRDKVIIGSTPIKGVTLNMAKIVHIAIYLGRIIFTMMIIPVAVTFISKGWLSALVLAVEAFLMAIFAVALTTIIYYVLISWCSGEQLKDIINWIQVVFIIVVISMQQLLPRVFQLINGEVTYEFHVWYYLIPPFWMAAPFEIVKNGVTHNGFIGLSICSIVIPFLLFILYVTKMAPYFETKLTKMNAGGSRKEAKIGIMKQLHESIGKILCKKSEEYYFYCFTRNMVSTERKYKLQAYPLIAMGVVFPFIFMMIMIDFTNGVSWIQQIKESRVYFYFYFTSLCLGQCLISAIRSENAKASWIYKMFPMTSTQFIYKGFLKAMFVKYMIPLMLYQSILMVAIWGALVIPYMLVININSFVLFMIYYKVVENQLPFTKGYSETGENNVGSTMIVCLMIFVIGGGHFAICSFAPYGNEIVGVVGLIAGILLYKTSLKNK